MPDDLLGEGAGALGGYELGKADGQAGGGTVCLTWLLAEWLPDGLAVRREGMSVSRGGGGSAGKGWASPPLRCHLRSPRRGWGG